MIDAARRWSGALALIAVTVVLAKAGQYAAIDHLAPATGFNAASLIGASPVVIVAALLQRRRGQKSRRRVSQEAR